MFLDSKMLERYVVAHEKLAASNERLAAAAEAANKTQKKLLDVQVQQMATTVALEAQLLGHGRDNN